MFRWFIETMSPLALADHPCTKKMFLDINPEFRPTSRRTVGRDIAKVMETTKTQLINRLFSQKWVATTADSWTAHNRTFLGMTVHYIDRDSLKRCHATLACKEVKVNKFKIELHFIEFYLGMKAISNYEVKIQFMN